MTSGQAARPEEVLQVCEEKILANARSKDPVRNWVAFLLTAVPRGLESTNGAPTMNGHSR